MDWFVGENQLQTGICAGICENTMIYGDGMDIWGYMRIIMGQQKGYKGQTNQYFGVQWNGLRGNLNLKPGENPRAFRCQCSLKVCKPIQ